MTLVKFRNANPISRYNVIPSVFSDFFSDFLNDDTLPGTTFKSIPAVNILETPESYRIELAAPGMNKSDFRISVENGILSISAEKKDEKAGEDRKYTRKEFVFTSFTRTFTMPDQVNADEVAADYTNGILTLNLPKKEEAKKKAMREISVQ